MSREVEFDFVDQGGGGKFVATTEVRGVVMRQLTVGEIEQAASLIATSAPEVGDYLLEEANTASVALRTALAEAFYKARDFERAGRAALLIDDPRRAAPFFERSYQFGRAAELYEQAGDLEKAAELYERNLRHDRAAELYLKVGRAERAAEAFEKGERYFDAGRIWAQLRHLDRAVDVLQKVGREHEAYVASTLLLGRILEHAGHRNAAAARYIEVVKSFPLDSTSVGVFERLGEIYAATGHTGPARKLLTAVVQLDPTRERASQALARLEATPPTSVAGERMSTLPSVPSIRGGGGPPPSVVPSTAAPRPPASVAAAAGPPPPAVVNLPSGASVAPLVLPPPPGCASTAVASVTTVHADVDVLRQLPIFSELSLGELRALHAIGERTTYAPGATIIEQDRPASLMLVMLKGTVVVTHVDERGGEAVLGELGYGAPIGEMALVDEGPTSARVRAKTDVAVFRWPMESLRRHLSTNERTTLRILRVMSRTLSVRLRETNARVIAAPAGRA